MEEFAIMEGTGVDPLHFHKQTDGERISNFLGCTGTHNIDNRWILVCFCKCFCRCERIGYSIFDCCIDVLRTFYHVFIVIISFILIQDFNSKHQDIVHLFKFSCIVFLESMNDNIICIFCKRWISIMCNSDYFCSFFLGEFGSCNSFRCCSTKGACNYNCCFIKGNRSCIVEFVCCVEACTDFSCITVHKILCRILFSRWCTTSNKK